MNSATASRLQSLHSDHPEWNPWLSVVGETLSEAVDPAWESFVPIVSRQQTRTPALAQAAIALPIDFLNTWIKRLIRSAAGSGTAQMAMLRNVEKPNVEAVQLFRAALCQDIAQIKQIALDSDTNATAFQSVAELLPIPFLQACGRRLTMLDEMNWQEGYCPLCGAWPALAEIRGIERARYLRCGRCGDEWQIHWLQCPFCDVNDHEQLVSLIPQNGDSARRIEGCKRCSGYLKSFTTLQGADKLGVMVNDLASVDLDIAAVKQGYRRPPGPGYFLGVSVGYNKSVIRRLFPGIR